MYEIIKINTQTEKQDNYGKGYTEQDIKEITKGYKFNGLFYERKNNKYIFIVNKQ